VPGIPTTRFGDPETEARFFLVCRRRLLAEIEAAVDGRLDQVQLAAAREPRGHDIGGLERLSGKPLKLATRSPA